MAASVNDKITDVRNSARPNTARVTTLRVATATNLACDSLTGWPTASKVHFVTYQVDTNNNVIAGTQLDCYGIVSANTITNLTVIDGTDGGNAVGDIVEMLPTAAWAQDLADGLMASHDRDGTLKDGAVDSADVLAANVVTTTKILDDAVTAAKLADSAVVTANIVDDSVTKAATVWNNVSFSGQTMTSSSFTDVTLATGSFTTTGGDLLLNGWFSGFVVAPGNTINYKILIGATETPSAAGFYHYWNIAANHTTVTFMSLATGIAAGTYTVKLQVKVNSGTFYTDTNDRCNLIITELKK
jgi:hypothetical protein